MTTITPLMAWLRAATPDEAELLAQRAGTSAAYLRHLAAPDDRAYKRQPSVALAGAIERETRAMAKASKGRLPEVLRTDLLEACRECPYAKRCLGERALIGAFDVVDERQLTLNLGD